MLSRYAIAIPGGLLITLLLVFAMQALITMGNRDLDDSGVRHFVDFVQAQREEIVERKDRKPERPPEPTAPPPDQPQPRTDAIDPLSDSISIGAAPMTTDVQLGGIGLGGGDGDYLPIVKVAPVYPQRALSRGIEGWVVVEFTVTTAGTVRDVRVVEAEPPGMFDTAAKDAALKFKYKPRVVDGEAIEVAGVQNRIVFQIER